MKNKQKQAYVAHHWNKSAKIYHQLRRRFEANKDESKDDFYRTSMLLSFVLNAAQ